MIREFVAAVEKDFRERHDAVRDSCANGGAADWPHYQRMRGQIETWAAAIGVMKDRARNFDPDGDDAT